MNIKSSCRIRPMKKAILLATLLLCPLLQGCVGFVIAREHTEVTNKPVIALKRTNQFPAHPQNTNPPVYTSEWLRTHWGPPDQIRRVGSGTGIGVNEIWTYRFGPIWKGVIPALIVPIPLVLPLGRQQVSFTLHSGHVVSVSSTGPDTGGIFWPKRL